MRTLKKVLALSLVCAMAFTMMAGAAFNDQSKINADLANDIELMTALSVFKGDDKGNLNPEDLLTRAQAAKLIYVLKNNGNDDNAVAFTGVSQYSDVPVGFWGEGYVNFCTNSGYMGGWAQNGTRMFDPEGKVTGVEMAKMLLCLIGHKADLQGYTGANWAANVTSDALNASIFADYGLSYNAPVARQWAARLLSNTINANVVTYSKGELTVSALTYAEKALKLETAVGTLEQTKSVVLAGPTASPVRAASTSNKSMINVATATTTEAVGKKEFSFDAPANLLGQQVKVYYKAGTEKGVANAQKIYSVMANDSRAYNVKLDAIKVTISGNEVSVAFPGMTKTNQNFAAVGSGATEVPAASIAVYSNYRLIDTLAYTDNAAAGVAGNHTINPKTLAFYGLGENDNETVKIITNDKNQIKAIYFNDAPYYAVVEAIDTAKCKFTVKAGTAAGTSKTHYLSTYGGLTEADNKLVIDTTDAGKKNFAKINFVDTVVKGDVVKITPTFAANVLGYKVEKLTPVTGKVTSFSGSYSTLTIDGTAYKVGANKVNAYKFSTADSLKAKDATTFYTDGKYLIYATGEKKSDTLTKNLAYVIAGQGTGEFSSGKVKLLLADNTVKTFNYTAKADLPNKAIPLPKEALLPEDITNAKTVVTKGVVYEYVLEENGTVSLKPLTDAEYAVGTPQTIGTDVTLGVATKALEYDKAGKSFTVDSRTVKSSADTIVFSTYTDINGVEKYSAVKGSELNSALTNNTGAQYAYTTATGLPVMIFGVAKYGTHDIPSSTTDGKFAVIVGEAETAGAIDRNNTLVKVAAMVDGKKTELKFKASNSGTAVEDLFTTVKANRNMLVTYSMNGEYVNSGTFKQVTAAKASTAEMNNAVWSKVSVKFADASTLFALDQMAAAKETFYNITADTKIMYVQAATDGTKHLVGLDSGEIAKGDEIASTGKYNTNALVLGKLNSDGKLDAKQIIVEVDGNELNSRIWSNGAYVNNQPLAKGAKG